MNAIGSGCKSYVSPRVDEDFNGKALAHFIVASFYHGERELEQLAAGEILFSNLNEVHTQMHLIANNLEQRAETADSFAIGDVVTLHPLARLAENIPSSIPDEVYSRGWNLKAKAFAAAKLFVFRFTYRSEHFVFKG